MRREGLFDGAHTGIEAVDLCVVVSDEVNFVLGGHGIPSPLQIDLGVLVN